MHTKEKNCEGTRRKLLNIGKQSSEIYYQKGISQTVYCFSFPYLYMTSKRPRSTSNGDHKYYGRFNLQHTKPLTIYTRKKNPSALDMYSLLAIIFNHKIAISPPSLPWNTLPWTSLRSSQALFLDTPLLRVHHLHKLEYNMPLVINEGQTKLYIICKANNNKTEKLWIAFITKNVSNLLWGKEMTPQCRLV